MKSGTAFLFSKKKKAVTQLWLNRHKTSIFRLSFRDNPRKPDENQKWIQLQESMLYHAWISENSNSLSINSSVAPLCLALKCPQRWVVLFM